MDKIKELIGKDLNVEVILKKNIYIYIKYKLLEIKKQKKLTKN